MIDELVVHACAVPLSLYNLQRNRRTPMMASTPGEIPEYELNPGELQFRKGDEVLKVQSIFFPFPIQEQNKHGKSRIKGETDCTRVKQGTYQVAKWNGTKVSVKIVDRESYCDQEAV
jgi:hypothetical protein